MPASTEITRRTAGRSKNADMLAFLKEFFNWTTERPVEGWFSWQHLVYVTLMVLLTVGLGIFFGMKYRAADRAKKLRVLKIAAILMLGLELFKIVICCVRAGSVWEFRGNLPLFLCSILLFSLPIGAFGRGRAQEAALDFSFAFGMLCCIAGTYLAGNIFGASPVLSFDPMVSTTTHCISGFSTIYIGVSGLKEMKMRNAPISCLILGVFEALALGVDILQRPTPYQSNYMFFTSPDGTPFQICYDLVAGNQVLYTVFVMLLYFVYLILFYAVYLFVYRAARKKREESRKTLAERGDS